MDLAGNLKHEFMQYRKVRHAVSPIFNAND